MDSTYAVFLERLQILCPLCLISCRVMLRFDLGGLLDEGWLCVCVCVCVCVCFGGNLWASVCKCGRNLMV